MPKLKSLSGDELITVFSRFGFEIISQKGSHVKLRRVLRKGIRETLTIPRHKELDKGTLRAIFRQALKYIPEGDLKAYFYTE